MYGCMWRVISREWGGEGGFYLIVKVDDKGLDGIVIWGCLSLIFINFLFIKFIFIIKLFIFIFLNYCV